MSTCRFCDGCGETCDMCGAPQAEEPFHCTDEKCYLEFCTDGCRDDHLKDKEVNDGE